MRDVLAEAVAPVDQWRVDVYTLAESFAEPIAVLLLVVAFVLGLMTVRAVTGG